MNNLPMSAGSHLDALLAHCHLRRYPNNGIIVHAEDPCASLYFIVSGSVSIFIEADERRDIVVAYLNKGEFFGEMGLFDVQQPPSSRSAWVRARESCEIAEISYGKFRALSRQHPDILYALGRQMNQRLRTTTRKVSDLAFTDVSGRIARMLQELCRQPDAMTHPDGMQIRITRQEIGRLVGCSREMAGRVLKALQQQGILHARGKTMVVYGTR